MNPLVTRGSLHHHQVRCVFNPVSMHSSMICVYDDALRYATWYMVAAEAVLVWDLNIRSLREELHMYQLGELFLLCRLCQLPPHSARCPPFPLQCV